MDQMRKTTWRQEIAAARREERDEDGELIYCTLSADQADKPFDDGYGGVEGHAFTAWTEKRVYFPVCYDGSEWVGSAPRNPCDEATRHQGGG